MHPPHVEVVLFTYNHEPFIARALASVLEQQAQFPISIRIHDDASTDDTVGVIRRVLAESAMPWSLTRAPENRYTKGIAYVPEFIAESTADFVAILDGDDFWTSTEKLQRQIDLLSLHPNAALCHHPTFTYQSGSLTEIAWPPAATRAAILPGSMLAEQNVVSTSSVVLRPTMFPQRFPAGFDRLRIGDYPMWALTSADREIAFVDEPMSAYRVHESNIWATLHPDDQFDRELEARIYISDNVPDDQRVQWRSGIIGLVKYRYEAEMQQKLQQLHAELTTLAAALDGSHAENRRLTASASWRVTRPLRWLRGRLPHRA